MPFFKTGIMSTTASTFVPATTYTQTIWGPYLEPIGLMDKATNQPITLAMQRLDLTGELTPLGASLQVTHKFKCEGTQPMEAVYVFMLPRGGTLRRFKIKGKGFESNSKLAPKEEAKEEYEAGVRHGHLSAMTEQAPDGMVSLTVGQVRPDEEVAIMLDIFCGVALQDSKFRFRFPFTLAPSYHAKMVVAPTADGGRIELPQTILGDLVLPEWKLDAKDLHQVSFNLKVRSAVTGISSPSHRVKTETKKGETTISLAEISDKPNRDLVLDVGMEIDKPMLFANGKGFAVPKNTPRWAVVVPSATLPQKDLGSKKLCFVLDHSGSMSGGPLDQAKLALSACLSALDAKDEFGIVAFENSPTAFKSCMIKASKANREEAQRFLEKIHPAGGTELRPALEMAVNGFDGTAGDIYLLTDGQVYESAAIVEQMAVGKVRVHVLGIGSASQDRFLASLAKKTGGVSKMMTPNEDVSSGALELFNSVKHPRQKDVTISAEGSSVTEAIVWDGKPIILYGNSSKVPTKMVLKFGKSSKTINLSTAASCPEGLVSLLWAGQMLEDLGSSIDGGLLNKQGVSDAEKKMQSISTMFNLSSRVMSLYAVVKRKGDKKQEMVQNVVAVGFPEGMNPAGVGFKGITQASLNVGRSSRFSAVKCRKVSSPTFDISDTEPMSWGGGGGYRSLNMSMMPGVYTAVADASINACFASDTVTASNSSASSNSLALYDSISDGPMFEHESSLVNTPALNFEEKTPSGRPTNWLIMDIGSLEEDGGMPEQDMESRVLRTLMLGLWILDSQGEDAYTRFGKHLSKMADFIERNLPNNRKALIKKVLDKFRGINCLTVNLGGESSSNMWEPNDKMHYWKVVESVTNG